MLIDIDILHILQNCHSSVGDTFIVGLTTRIVACLCLYCPEIPDILVSRPLWPDYLRILDSLASKHLDPFMNGSEVETERSIMEMIRIIVMAKPWPDDFLSIFIPIFWSILEQKQLYIIPYVTDCLSVMIKSGHGSVTIESGIVAKLSKMMTMSNESIWKNVLSVLLDLSSCSEDTFLEVIDVPVLCAMFVQHPIEKVGPDCLLLLANCIARCPEIVESIDWMKIVGKLKFVATGIGLGYDMKKAFSWLMMNVIWCGNEKAMRVFFESDLALELNDVWKDLDSEEALFCLRQFAKCKAMIKARGVVTECEQMFFSNIEEILEEWSVDDALKEEVCCFQELLTGSNGEV
jgi:hypothetical protein